MSMKFPRLLGLASCNNGVTGRGAFRNKTGLEPVAHFLKRMPADVEAPNHFLSDAKDDVRDKDDASHET